mgnify:CR=1 FL=1
MIAIARPGNTVSHQESGRYFAPSATIVAVAQSVARTRRVVIVDEGWKSGGIGAEIAARLAEDSLYELDAPVRRVAGREVPVPYAAQLEAAALPSAEAVAAAVRAVVPRR